MIWPLDEPENRRTIAIAANVTTRVANAPIFFIFDSIVVSSIQETSNQSWTHESICNETNEIVPVLGTPLARCRGQGLPDQPRRFYSETTSPPARVPRLRQAAIAIPEENQRTEPSAIAAFTPPG